MDGRFTKDWHPVINFVSTIDKVPQVLWICLSRRFIKVLNHISCVFILANLERILGESCRARLSSQLDQCSRGGRCTEVTCNVQRRVIVYILLVKHLLEEKSCLSFEIAHNLIIVTSWDKLFEFTQNMYTASWVIGILNIFEILNLHEELHELVEALNNIDIDLQQRFQCLITLRELVHCSIVKRVSFQRWILLWQNLSVPCNDITCVLFEQTDQAQIKLPMSLNCICIVLYCLNKFSLLDVHSFHSETQLFLLKLIIHDFLQAHALKAKHVDKAVIVALVG